MTRHPALRAVPLMSWGLAMLACFALGAHSIARVGPAPIRILLAGALFGLVAAQSFNLALYLSRLLRWPSPDELERLLPAGKVVDAPDRCPECDAEMVRIGGAWSAAAARTLWTYRCRSGHGWMEHALPLLVDLRFDRWPAGDRLAEPGRSS